MSFPHKNEEYDRDPYSIVWCSWEMLRMSEKKKNLVFITVDVDFLLYAETPVCNRICIASLKTSQNCHALRICMMWRD